MIHKLIYALKTTCLKAVRMPDFISHLINARSASTTLLIAFEQIYRDTYKYVVVN